MAWRKRNKASEFFTTVSDIGSLFMAAIYFLYVALLLIFKIGTTWLNYTMLFITIIYLLFFILKIALLNRIVKEKRAFRITKITLKYTKWGMKLINALFVAISIANVQVSGSGGNVIAFIGILVVGFSFVISILWDTGWWLARRKLYEIRTGWDLLTERQKKSRIELVIGSIIRSLDSVTGLELSQSAEAFINKQIESPKKKELLEAKPEHKKESVEPNQSK